MKLCKATVEVTAYVWIHDNDPRDLKEICEDAIKDEIEFNGFTARNSTLNIDEMKSKSDVIEQHLSVYPWETKIEDEDLTVEQIFDKYSNQVQPQPLNA